LLTNTLPVRARFAPQASVLDWLWAFQKQLLDLRAYEHTPLTAVQSWSEIPPDQPLFTTLIVYQSYPHPLSTGRRNRSSGLRLIRHVQLPVDAAHCSQSIAGQGFHFILFMTRIFLHPAAVRRLWEHYLALLARIAADPAPSAAQRCRWLRRQKNAGCSQLSDRRRTNRLPVCLHDWFAQIAAAQPDAPALTMDGRSLTYAELEARANQLAHYLREQGVGPEKLVGLFMERSPEMVIAVLAIVKAGGAYLPMDPLYPPERLAFMIADAAPLLTLTQSDMAARLPETAVLSLDAADGLLAAPYPQTAPETAVQPTIPPTSSTPPAPPAGRKGCSSPTPMSPASSPLPRIGTTSPRTTSGRSSIPSPSTFPSGNSGARCFTAAVWSLCRI
jgi:non-ribosomal peptide synthetase component F